jgi:hypothetical protein
MTNCPPSERRTSGDSELITQEMINELVHRVTNEPLEMRDAAKKLTGEWIVFLKQGGKNYYLCVNTHKAGDQVIMIGS